MSIICKKLLLVLLITWTSMGLVQNAIAYEVVSGNCSDANECVVFLKNPVPTQDKLCNSSDFSVTWTPGDGKYLIQCRSSGSDEDNVVWIVDSNARIFARLNYGRFIKKSVLEKTPNMEIPDKFRSRSLCSPIDMSMLRAGDFVLLDKRPADEGENPYCYAPVYLMLKGGKLVVSINGGSARRSDPDHAVHSVSARDKQLLNRLLDVLRQWHP
ncbi:hypothetical protein [Paraburkholderia sp. ZP32-5]|uniref:hypothetical protein n=1 Tax=Paraburkholderia sp. ZP32-5 TaxID=2883245 RepID=UPI001F203AFE|nr:hypothetical protein [Paraburkholderia sp. ZP32-5]